MYARRHRRDRHGARERGATRGQRWRRDQEALRLPPSGSSRTVPGYSPPSGFPFPDGFAARDEPCEDRLACGFPCDFTGAEDARGALGALRAPERSGEDFGARGAACDGAVRVGAEVRGALRVTPDDPFAFGAFIGDEYAPADRDGEEYVPPDDRDGEEYVPPVRDGVGLVRGAVLCDALVFTGLKSGLNSGAERGCAPRGCAVRFASSASFAG